MVEDKSHSRAAFDKHDGGWELAGQGAKIESVAESSERVHIFHKASTPGKVVRLSMQHASDTPNGGERRKLFEQPKKIVIFRTPTCHHPGGRGFPLGQVLHVAGLPQ